MAVEITLERQIGFLEACLMFEPKENLVLNPFVGISNVSLLREILNSLNELKERREQGGGGKSMSNV